MIEIIGTALYQWDTGRSVSVSGIDADRVHFANKGDSRAVIMDIVGSQAKIPDYLLQTGKQLCVYAVKNGVTVECKTFVVKNRERPENYVYDEDHRNYIYELITDVETAVADANRAVSIASTASSNANLATENARKAADDANEAAEGANEAAEIAKDAVNAVNIAVKNANEAADKANNTAKSLMVVGSAEGENIYLDDAIDQFVVGLRVFGKTTQDGTPTPTAPVELESVVNPAVTVINQTLLLPYTLHGIPVTSGGNYTDANGQQWICDEIDLANGVRIKRLEKVDIGTLEWQVDTDNGRFVTNSLSTKLKRAVRLTPLMSSIGYDCKSGGESFVKWDYAIYVGGTSFYIHDTSCTTLEELTAKVSGEMVVYPLGTPIETPLSEAELAAFAAMRTNRGSTTVSNDASAHMEIEYVMDAKKYIDSLIGTSASAARMAYINLPASQWVGSGSLYSQVVSIDGITENSQVNLAPSVEQMATFYDKDITFVTQNDGGVVTVYVIGQKPQNDYTIQADIVEVIE